jgi:hypothetical protein
MSAIIEQILRLSGPMPDAAAHARYLETLSQTQLQARAAALVDVQPKAERAQVDFWRGVKRNVAYATERRETIC